MLDTTAKPEMSVFHRKSTCSMAMINGTQTCYLYVYCLLSSFSRPLASTIRCYICDKVSLVLIDFERKMSRTACVYRLHLFKSIFIRKINFVFIRRVNLFYRSASREVWERIRFLPMLTTNENQSYHNKSQIANRLKRFSEL